MYLTNILSKKNYISIKKLDISNNILKILQDLHLNKSKSKSNSKKISKNISKSISRNISKNNIIESIIDHIDNLYIFKKNIEKYDDKLILTINKIQKFNKPSYKSSQQYKEVLKENIDKTVSNYAEYLNEFNKLLGWTSNTKSINQNSITSRLDNADKRFLYKFTINYLNLINTFYKLYVYSYEWSYFATTSNNLSN